MDDAHRQETPKTEQDNVIALPSRAEAEDQQVVEETALLLEELAARLREGELSSVALAVVPLEAQPLTAHFTYTAARIELTGAVALLQAQVVNAVMRAEGMLHAGSDDSASGENG